MPGLDITELDALLAARVQLAANISFHILFTSLTLGLSWALVYFRLHSGRGGGRGWRDAYRFWVKVFALGVVSGATMSFHFGTN